MYVIHTFISHMSRSAQGHDHAKLRKHQFIFMKSAFSGGKFKYTERSMDVAHAKLFEMGLDVRNSIWWRDTWCLPCDLNVPEDIITDVVGSAPYLRVWI